MRTRPCICPLRFLFTECPGTGFKSFRWDRKVGKYGALSYSQCSELASLDKNNSLREIKLRSSYLQGKSTATSVIAHQTEKEWISANKKNRQRMAQTHAEGTAEQLAARLEDAHLRAHH
ncbi:hypothetical protein TNCV_4115781 [Trichonephila clavipes]|nr:hypothetical protein TNCV_4115781 [Trichonephila clavipes]